MLGIQAAALVMNGPLLIFIGVLRMLVEAARLLVEMGHELALEVRWLLGGL